MDTGTVFGFSGSIVQVLLYGHFSKDLPRSEPCLSLFYWIHCSGLTLPPLMHGIAKQQNPVLGERLCRPSAILCNTEICILFLPVGLGVPHSFLLCSFPQHPFYCYSASVATPCTNSDHLCLYTSPCTGGGGLNPSVPGWCLLEAGFQRGAWDPRVLGWCIVEIRFWWSSWSRMLARRRKDTMLEREPHESV